MTAETCPMCGSPVRVVSSGEGTSHYESVAQAEIEESDLTVGGRSLSVIVVDEHGQEHLPVNLFVPDDGPSDTLTVEQGGIKVTLSDRHHALVLDFRSGTA